MAAVDCNARAERENRTIARALRILEKRMKYAPERAELSSPFLVRQFLRLRLGELEREEFWCVWLDAQNRHIASECLFTGTLTQTSVYPREIVKQGLTFNAAAVIFAHNHPSGIAEPSHADQVLTQSLKQALALVDIKVLDHFIIGFDSAMGFAERGLI